MTNLNLKSKSIAIIFCLVSAATFNPSFSAASKRLVNKLHAKIPKIHRQIPKLRRPELHMLENISNYFIAQSSRLEALEVDTNKLKQENNKLREENNKLAQDNSNLRQKNNALWHKANKLEQRKAATPKTK